MRPAWGSGGGGALANKDTQMRLFRQEFSVANKNISSYSSFFERKIRGYRFQFFSGIRDLACFYEDLCKAGTKSVFGGRIRTWMISGGVEKLD